MKIWSMTLLLFYFMFIFCCDFEVLLGTGLVTCQTHVFELLFFLLLNSVKKKIIVKTKMSARISGLVWH